MEGANESTELRRHPCLFNCIVKFHCNLECYQKWPKKKFYRIGPRDQYKACMDLDQIERISLQPLKDILKKFGGWPVLEDNWNEANFNWQVLDHSPTTMTSMLSKDC